jgi:hypothetical protein
MYTDLYSLYKLNTEAVGFWFKKKNWCNHVAQVLKVNKRFEGNLLLSDNHEVIVMLMDTRDNKIHEIVEISEPDKPKFKQLNKQFIPNYDLPQYVLDYLSKA